MKNIKKWFAAGTVYVACFQLAFAQSIALMPDSGAERKHDFWSRFVSSSSPSKVHIIVLNAEQVSPETRAARGELEANGGRGRYERIEGLRSPKADAIEAIRVLAPPRNPIYGSAFDDIFGELQAHGVPVFIDAHLQEKWKAGGVVISWNQFGPDARAIFLMTTRGGNIVGRHELQHVRDLVTDSVEFYSMLPEPPSWLIHLLEKREAGEALEEWEARVLNMVGLVLVSLVEVRASEATLASLFTARGLDEIADPQTWPWEVKFYFNEIFNASLRNIALFYSLQESDIPHAYNEWAILSKSVLYAAAGLAILIPGAIFVMHWFFKALEVAFKASRRPFGQCASLAKSLFRSSLPKL